MLLDYLAKEKAKKERIVITNEHWTVLVPYWACWPYEVMLIPHRHVLSLDDLNPVALTNFLSLALRFCNFRMKLQLYLSLRKLFTLNLITFLNVIFLTPWVGSALQVENTSTRITNTGNCIANTCHLQFDLRPFENIWLLMKQWLRNKEILLPKRCVFAPFIYLLKVHFRRLKPFAIKAPFITHREIQKRYESFFPFSQFIFCYVKIRSSIIEFFQKI